MLSVPRYHETTRSISHVVAPFVEFSWKHTATHIMLHSAPYSSSIAQRSVEDDHHRHRERSGQPFAPCGTQGDRWRDVFEMERGWHHRGDVTWEVCISRIFTSLMNVDRICRRDERVIKRALWSWAVPPSMITSAMVLNKFRILLRNIIYDREAMRDDE